MTTMKNISRPRRISYPNYILIFFMTVWDYVSEGISKYLKNKLFNYMLILKIIYKF